MSFLKQQFLLGEAAMMYLEPEYASVWPSQCKMLSSIGSSCHSCRSVLQFLRLLLKIGETPCAVIAMVCGSCFFGFDEIPFARTEEMPFYKTSAKYINNAQMLNSKMKNPLQQKPWFSD